MFKPILTDILEVFINYFMSVIWSMWSEWLLGILAIVCSLVDFVENIFNVFAGISPVTVGEKSTYLLDAFFQMQEVTYAFANITLLAVAISFLFTIYKTAKSISDMALEDKNPVSKVLGNGLKAAVTFMLIPFLCIAMLQISSVVTNQAVSAFESAQGKSTTGTVIFLSAGLDALSPLKVLGRGYAIARRGEDVVSSCAQVEAGDRLDVLVAGGVLNCVVKDKEERTWR